MRTLASSVLLLACSPALAQSFDAHGFIPSPDDGDLADLVTTWRPELQAPGSLGVSGIFEFAESPFVQYRQSGSGDPVREALLDDVFALNLGLHAAVHERVGLSVTGPVYLTSAGIDGPQGPSVGDFRLAIPIGLVLAGDAEGGFGLSAVPFVGIPFGAPDRFQSDDGLGGGAIVTAGWHGGPLDVAYNLGFETGPSPDIYNLRDGSQLLTAIGGSYALSETFALRGEFTYRAALAKNDVAGTGSPGEVLLSARGVPAGIGGVSWMAGGAAGVTPGASAAAYRVFAGIGYAKGKVRDADGDGFVDAVDACPNEAETTNDYHDDDGCPDALSSVRVKVLDPEGNPMAGVPVSIGGEEVGRTDANGVLVLEGRMPGETVDVGLTPSKKTGMGETAQAGITLDEGETAVEMQLAWLPGAVRVVTRAQDGKALDASVSFIGPEARDPEGLGEDGEEVFVLSPGDWSLLVSAPEFGTERKDLTIEPNQLSLVVIEVVLAPAIVQMTTEEVVILEPVQFDLDKATIRPESEALLTQVANNILANPEIKRVEVQGHTDSQGRDRYNLDLSQRRVDAVLDYLKRAGVQDSRITSVGYGEACPLADNRTEEGRAVNRRVQFIVLDPAPAGGVPCHDGNPARRAEALTIERTIEVEQ